MTMRETLQAQIWDTLSARQQYHIHDYMEHISRVYSDKEKDALLGLIIYHLAENTPDSRKFLRQVHSDDAANFSVMFKKSVVAADRIKELCLPATTLLFESATRPAQAAEIEPVADIPPIHLPVQPRAERKEFRSTIFTSTHDPRSKSFAVDVNSRPECLILSIK